MRRTCQGPSRPRPWHDSARLTVSARYVELSNCSVSTSSELCLTLDGTRLATVVIRSCGPRPRRTTSLADGRGGGSRIRQRVGGRRGRGHGREQLIVGVVRGDAGARAACRAASRVGGGHRAVRVIEGTDHVLPGARGSSADAGVGALSMTPAGIPGGPRLVERSAAGVVTRRRHYSRQAVLPVVAGGEVVRAVPRDGG